MADWVVFYRWIADVARVINASDTVIVLSQVEANVYSWTRPDGLVEHLSHARMIDLVHNNIKFETSCQSIHLQLPTPDTVLNHVVAILVNCLIILDKRRIHVLVSPYIVNSFNPVPHMLTLVSVELIGKSPEQAVSIGLRLFNFEIEGCQLLSELFHVLLV